jgi:hypothetical protein
MTVFTGTDLTVVALAGVCVIAVFIFRRGLGTGRAQYPPGPEGLPLLGNALDIPKERQWETFNTWKKTYGVYATDSALVQLCRMVHIVR